MFLSLFTYLFIHLCHTCFLVYLMTFPEVYKSFYNSYNRSQQNNSTCFRQTYCPSSGILKLYSEQLVWMSNFYKSCIVQRKRDFERHNRKPYWLKLTSESLNWFPVIFLNGLQNATQNLNQSKAVSWRVG
jgi:hypothetical protein